MDETRENEWFAPKFGPARFRRLLGLTFFPYSLMNASYVLIGSLLAPSVHYDRMVGIALVYLLAVGVSAHSLDAMGPNKPWGSVLGRRQLMILALAGLIPALGLGLYYAVMFAPALLPLGLVELFFLLSYNLELFSGRFHTDFWFAVSWGFLPVLAGFVVQTNGLSWASLVAGLFGFTTAFVEINASRPYKALKKSTAGDSSQVAERLEAILKGIVTTVFAAVGFLLLRSVFG